MILDLAYSLYRRELLFLSDSYYLEDPARTCYNTLSPTHSTPTTIFD